MSRDYVFYRDVEMVSDWPDKIRAAQKQPRWLVESTPGHTFEVDRVRFAGPGNCGDCAVMPNEFHVPGCDIEACPVCGRQIISCPCKIERTRA